MTSNEFNSNPDIAIGALGDLAYDLRIYYAKIVGEHLIDIANARKEKNYPQYLNSLENLYVVVAHKIKKYEDKENKDKKDKAVTYESLRTNAVTLVNQYHGVYVHNHGDKKGTGMIEEALKKIEMYLYEKMSDAGMFGSKRDIASLL